jgi:hypothetical protein
MAVLWIRENNVNINYVIKKNMNSGLALITVDLNGENHIVLSEGANGCTKYRNVDNVLEQSILPVEVKEYNSELYNALKILEQFDLEYVTHEEFKLMKKKAKAVIRTGECSIILRSVIIFNQKW